jgi:hypothetical protein
MPVRTDPINKAAPCLHRKAQLAPVTDPTYRPAGASAPTMSAETLARGLGGCGMPAVAQALLGFVSAWAMSTRPRTAGQWPHTVLFSSTNCLRCALARWRRLSLFPIGYIVDDETWEP